MEIKEFRKVLEARQILGIIDSMQPGGWRSDLPIFNVKVQEGIDTVCDKDFIENILNKELNTALKKLEKKVHNKIAKVQKECLKTLEAVDGMKEDLFEHHPFLDPDYVAPELPPAEAK